MSTSASYEGRTVVRLSQVPRDLRERVAEEMVERLGLRGVDAALVMLSAAIPRQDPELEVSAEKWEAVQRGVRPRGDSVWRFLA